MKIVANDITLDLENLTIEDSEYIISSSEKDTFHYSD